MKKLKFNPNNVTAVVQINETEVEIRYGDGKDPVVLSDTTSSQVLADITKYKSSTDSA